MNPNQYLDALRRSWAVLIVMIILGALVGAGLSLAATPLYTARAQLYFSASAGTSATDLNQGSAYTQSQMLSFAQLATSPAVLDTVIENEKLGISASELASSIDATTPQNTVVLEVASTQGSAQQAAAIANAVASSLVTEVVDLAPSTTTGRKAITATIIAPATAPATPSSPDTRRNVLAGLLIGLIVGVLIVFLRYRLDSRVHDGSVLAEITDVPLLGAIETHGRRKPRPAPAGTIAPLAEDFRQLGAHLASVGNGTSKLSVLVTSSIHGEGSSEVAIGLSAALSERRRVLLIDANLRHPHIASLAGFDAQPGLSSILQDDHSPLDLVLKWERHGFDVLPAGPAVANPGVLLSTASFTTMMRKFKTRYDVIIIDAAPVAVAADASILGSLVDGALVVADSTAVREAQLAAALDSLERSNVTVLGIVLNRVPRSGRRGAAEKPVGRPAITPKPDATSMVTPSDDKPVATEASQR